MALTDTSQAMGAVTQLVVNHVNQSTQQNVTVGHPEPPANTTISSPRLNVFLYEATFDPHMREIALDNGQRPPLWLVLRFLMTPFDVDGRSDTALAHRILGNGLRALQQLSFALSLSGLAPPDLAALDPNPEPLQITFQEASIDLLSRIMQGADERYRFSMAFEVRPVMIATGEPPSYALLIGVDYEAPPPGLIGEDGIKLQVEPSLGPVITAVMPTVFNLGDQVTILGEDLDASVSVARLGTVDLPVTPQSGALQFVADPTSLTGATISAGSHALAVVKKLQSPRERSSNLHVVGLRPRVNSHTVLNRQFVGPAGPTQKIKANINFNGLLLGAATDDVFVALHDGETTVLGFDDAKDRAGPPQARKRIEITDATAVPPGKYRLIVRVNGQQATSSPQVDLSTAP